MTTALHFSKVLLSAAEAVEGTFRLRAKGSKVEPLWVGLKLANT